MLKKNVSYNAWAKCMIDDTNFAKIPKQDFFFTYYAQFGIRKELK